MSIAFAVIALLNSQAFSQQFPEVPDDMGPYGSARHLEPIPTPPDYHQEASWALSISDEAPRPKRSRSSRVLTSEPGADVFYLHPTLLLEGPEWNADVYDEEMNSEVDKWPVRHQASAFAGAGRVFAPRYRQAHVRIFDLGDSLSYAAAAIAYGDIREAFLHYMKHWNDGRPVIIAGHSQGSYHGRTLLKEFFDNEEARAQLVAAYLPGMDMYLNDFDTLRSCEGPEETGCLCTWMTYHDGYLPPWLVKKKERHSAETSAVPLCINPITWTSDKSWSPKDQHLGLVRPGFWLSRPRSLQGRVSEEGVFHVQRPEVFGARWFQRNDWHSGDINLVWANVHENVQRRTLMWHKKHNN